jgi:RimJ/RimL family protein N-acetyltransferase
MRLFGDVLFDADEGVAEFVRQRIAAMKAPFVNYVALGVVHNGKLAGGIVYHDNTGHDIMASAAFTTLRWWKPETVKTLFAYPFITNKSARVSIKTSENNTRARRMIERLGFKQEGFHPLAIDGLNNAVSYGMTRDDCTWLKD